MLNMGIERARRDGNLRELGTLLCTFARLHWTAPVKDGATREARFAAARCALEEALHLEHSRDWDFVQAAHEELCALLREEGGWKEALEHLEEAHRIALRLGAASADERLALQRSESETADQRARADAEAARSAAGKPRLQALLDRIEAGPRFSPKAPQKPATNPAPGGPRCRGVRRPHRISRDAVATQPAFSAPGDEPKSHPNKDLLDGLLTRRGRKWGCGLAFGVF